MRSCWRTLAPFRAFSCLNKGTAMPDPRPDDRKIENENQKPDRPGQPPRPATEPDGAKGSSNSGQTETDPATGRPNP